METAQSLNIQCFNPGVHDVRSSGLSAQNPAKANSNPIPFPANKKTDVNTLNPDKPVDKNLEKAIPDILKDLQKKIDQMQDIGLQFSEYKHSGKMIVRVVEKETNKVIREIPSEEFMELAEKMDQMIGILFNKKI